MSNPETILNSLFGPGFTREYPGGLPEALAPWHLYLADAGHSIVCLLEGHTASPPSVDDLCPVPVKTVLRGYRFEKIDGMPVVVATTGFTYDPDLGLVPLHPEDEEF